MKRIIGLTVFLLLLAACGQQYGSGYHPSELSDLEPGKSTVRDAEILFGKATSVMDVPGKGTLYQWQFRKEKAAPGATDSHVAILFDGDGKMVRIVKATRR